MRWVWRFGGGGIGWWDTFGDDGLVEGIWDFKIDGNLLEMLG